MTRRIYPRPPIVEAVIDIRFSPDVKGADLHDALVREVGEKYSGKPKKQERFEIQASMKKDSMETTARRSPHVSLIQSGDGLRLLGCGDGMLSIHVLAPYPGWDAFIEQATEAIDAVSDTLARHQVMQLAVRYIDRISVPVDDGATLSDYLTVMPAKPAAMPPQLAGFHFVTQTVDPDEGTLALLTLASAPPDERGRPVVLYDLSVHRTGDPLCGFDEAGWRPVVEALHEQLRDIFEESITEQLRETFQ